MRHPAFVARAFRMYDHQEYSTLSGCKYLYASTKPQPSSFWKASRS